MSLCLLFLIVLTGVCFSTIFLIEKQPEDNAPKIKELDVNDPKESDLEGEADSLNSNNSQNISLESGKVIEQNQPFSLKEAPQSSSASVS